MSSIRTCFTIPYGPAKAQQGDLYLPDKKHPPVVCLLHGGFWRMPYGRDELAPHATDLVNRGYAVWNLEYRRLGSPGAGYPGTFMDVSDGIDHLAALYKKGMDIDLSRVVVIGYSAGGHLALWAAKRNQMLKGTPQPEHVRIAAVCGLAPITDLAEAYQLNLGQGAVANLMGFPQENPTRYKVASPMELLPLEVPQLLVHGSNDKAVPVEMVRSYAEKAQKANDVVKFVEIPGMGHFEHLDIHSRSWSCVNLWLTQALDS